MNLLEVFTSSLLSQKQTASPATIKNYRADVGQFIKWCETTYGFFNPNFTTPQTFESYRQSRTETGAHADALSERTWQRHTSSLRKFYSFLSEQGYITTNPFSSMKNETPVKEDPYKIRDFKTQLFADKISDLTIKNYIIDIKQFLTWAQEVTRDQSEFTLEENDLFARITPSLLEEYKNRLVHIQGASPKTVNRKLSSLRKYLSWAVKRGLMVHENTQLLQNQQLEKLSANIASETDTLAELLSAPLAAASLESSPVSSYSSFPPKRLFQRSVKAMDVLFDHLITFPVSRALDWADYHFREQSIFSKHLLITKITAQGKQGQKEYHLSRYIEGLPSKSLVPHNITKSFYAPFDLSIAQFSFPQKIWHMIRYTRPKWYYLYHRYALVHYIHFAILIVVASCMGLTLFRHITATGTSQQILGAQITSEQTRLLPFRQRLTDQFHNPVTAAQQLRFILYNDDSASGSAKLWEEVNTVYPDREGMFSITLGKRTGGIPQTVFSQNAEVWVGVTIGTESELTPRAQIPSIDLATTAQNLQGLLPITESSAGTKNVVLALDSSGNLMIGGNASPIFQATNGSFTLSGQPLILTTNIGSGKDVQIAPDGLGKIDLQKPLHNSTNYSSIPGVVGGVEIDDTLVVLATSSMQSAFIINQNDIGPLISASTSGTAKFTVGNDGTGYFAGNVGIGTQNPSYALSIQGKGSFGPHILLQNTDSTSKNTGILFRDAKNNTIGEIGTDTIGNGRNDLRIKDASGTVITLDGSGNVGIGTATPSALLTVGGNKGFRVDSNGAITGATGLTSSGQITFSNLTTNGGILYTNASGVLQQISGASTQCLFGGATPYFADCPSGSTPLFAASNGTVYQANSTVDFLLGGQSTQSAKIAFLNINAGTPTASISAGTTAIYVSGDGAIGTANRGSLVLGNSSLHNTTGNVLINPGSGNVGIGTDTPQAKLDVVGGAHFACPTSYTYANPNVTCSDVAELYDSSEGLEPGDVISIVEAHTVGRTTLAYQSAVGVYSTSPGVLIGGGTRIGEQTVPQGKIPVALVGRVPTKVSTENGPIQPGDLLTTSSIPGVAMKATQAGPVIGKALESYNSVGIEKILIMVETGWANPTITLSSTGSLSLEKNVQANGLPGTPSSAAPTYVIKDGDTLIRKIDAFTEAVIANVRAGSITAEEITVKTLQATQGLVATAIQSEALTVTSEQVTIAGKTLKEYIVATIHEAISTGTLTVSTTAPLVSPISQSQMVATNLLSPLSSDTIIVDGRLTIEGTNTHAPALDVHGDASISGHLAATHVSSDQLVSSDASISGILRAGRIIADSIETTSPQASPIPNITNITNIYQSTPSSTLALDTPLNIATFSSHLAYIHNFSSDFARIDSIQARLAQFDQGLIALGPVSLSDTAIAGQLAINGNFILSDNSINVLGADLALQPLRQGGISLMGGLISIDTDGNLSVGGNATFAHNVSIGGVLSANILSPIPGSDLVIRLGGSEQIASDRFNPPSSFAITNASNAAVFRVTPLGDVIASGAATLAKLNFNPIAPALAVSEKEYIATGSAGTAVLKKHQIEVTLYNSMVTSNSLIYITPVGTPSGQTPYLLRQKPHESFTVGVSTETGKNTYFNWLIVN